MRIAYMNFADSNGLSKALELSNTELGGAYLTVEEAKPRDSSFGSDGGGGRFGGGRSDRGGRFGGGGRSGGGRFNSRPSMATPGTGKKTTFDDRARKKRLD